MNVKATLLFVLLLLGGGFFVQAKNEASPEGIKALKVTAESLKKELDLSDEQSKKLQPLLEQVNKLYESFKKELFKQRKKSSSLNGSDGSPEAMKKRIEQLQKKIVKIIDPAKSFLSEEQFKKLPEKITKVVSSIKSAPEEGGNGKDGADSADAAP